MSEKLKDKIAIVTGSSLGIGKAIALAFAKQGAIVVTNSRKLERAEVTASEIRHLGRQAHAIEADLTKSTDVDHLIDTTIEHFGRIDILVNNAGIAMIVPTEDLSEHDWDRAIDIDLKATFLCSQKAAKRAMIPQRSGVIINISSILAKTALPMRAAYCASKAGVMALTQVMGCEWAKYRIRVVAIGPGYILTELVQQSIDTGVFNAETLIDRTPMKRLGKLDEIANLAVFLASDDAGYITGEIIYVDGGMTATGGW
ncbi:SDR family NAD(P)-dependent oxidoreductase [Candidatus Borrarchaeum sp.]|uniref:SDR family NAD(P)-dependent oxidoreductase n=1 Tax=Candidatus Borrarchaeum sp. TaxID=2846742 RepID=UPI002580A734|nr:SDR family NAD(P)-dependent oxidoreductase [Candidatus Borrarchaeum sp.]